ASLLPVRTLSNAIAFAGTQSVAMVAPGGALTTINGAYAADAFFGVGGNTDLRFTGPVALGSNIERTLNVASASRVVTLSGAITGTGSAGLIAAGGGYLKLTNSSNSYSGITAVATSTTLVIGTAGALPATSTLVGAGGSIGFWDISTTFNNNVNLVGNLAFDIGVGQTVTQSASSVISNTGILTKAGLGTLVLGGTNTFGQTGQAVLAGQIALNAGVLSISSDANLGNPNPVVAVGSIIQPGGITFGGGQLLVTDNVTTNRVLTMSGVGSIVVAHAQTLAEMENTGCIEMLKHDKRVELKLMFNVFRRSESTLSHITSKMTPYIESKGTLIVTDQEKQQDPLKYTDALLAFKHEIDTLV
ncbi:MAG: hypothetical protein EBR81_17565, partial [Proteobacteria bacterium]|nr:hypothetical protein [Pseudomonadota bacterium]